jgi:putative methionine-R-sulfoxide reductase with GAF domain
VTADPDARHSSTADYDDAARAIGDAIASAADAADAMSRCVDILKSRFSTYTWVGIYLLEGDELVLGPFRGAPSPHTRIPLGRGICGAAATARTTIVVDDVHADDRYLACSLETKSEIVVPIIGRSQVLGEIDIDSDLPAAFGASDRRMLEDIAAALAVRL